VETPGAIAGHHVHLASVRQTGEAPDEWRRLQKAYPVLLGGLDLTVAQIDLGTGRGVWYRVLGGVLARAEARRRCGEFTRRGIWCAVRRIGAASVEQRVATTQPAPAATEAVTPPAGTNDYRIHLASIRREANAAAEWRRLQRLFRGLLADLRYSVMRTDLGAERGVWYRIQGGPLARAEARTRCAAFAAQQHWCRVIPPPGPSSQSNQRFLALRVRRRGVAGTRCTRRPRPDRNPEPGARREQS
jgi:hypothetical protein